MWCNKPILTVIYCVLLLVSYFCGHDHSLQYINDTGINYFVCGAGHRTEESESHLVR